MPWLSVVQARKAESVGDGVEIRGWVRTRRDSKGGFSFLEINDGSCMGNLQVIVPAELGNYQSEVLKLGAGCSVVARMGKPSAGSAALPPAEFIGRLETSGGSETSQYPEERKSTETP